MKAFGTYWPLEQLRRQKALIKRRTARQTRKALGKNIPATHQEEKEHRSTNRATKARA